MIFVSVGTQLPFERLIQGMDEWAKSNPGTEVFAQIGSTRYRPVNMEFVSKMPPVDYLNKFVGASVVVSHCGMGTIITGLDNAKPMVLMPRKFELGEHRNDHQFGTASRFSHIALIDIVHSTEEMAQAVSSRLSNAGPQTRTISIQTSPTLVERLRLFVRPGGIDGIR